MSGWMPEIDPGWQGVTAFYELIFGTWIAYALLVWIWEGWLKTPLREWRYAMIIFIAAGAFWVNHYFSGKPPAGAPKSPWLLLINLYMVFFFVVYWRTAIGPQPGKSLGWKLLALATGIVLTVGFIAAEQLARYGVAHWGMHEFCWMSLAFLGFVWLIRWRGKAPVRPELGKLEAYQTYKWHGLGSPHD